METSNILRINFEPRGADAVEVRNPVDADVIILPVVRRLNALAPPPQDGPPPRMTPVRMPRQLPPALTIALCAIFLALTR